MIPAACQVDFERIIASMFNEFGFCGDKAHGVPAAAHRTCVGGGAMNQAAIV
jgi:hypothetical protein